MARTVPAHKQNFVDFIQPNYAKVAQVDGRQIGTQFQTFQDLCLSQVPDQGAPADAYMYNSHMGNFVRSLDEAKDHYYKAKMAFYAKRGSGSVAPSGDDETNK